MKVYVVFDQIYEEAFNYGVFSTREKAEEFRKLYEEASRRFNPSAKFDAEIQEWELDEMNLL